MNARTVITHVQTPGMGTGVESVPAGGVSLRKITDGPRYVATFGTLYAYGTLVGRSGRVPVLLIDAGAPVLAGEVVVARGALPLSADSTVSGGGSVFAL